MNLLQKIFSSIPVSQRETIRQVLDSLRKASLAETDREIQFEARRLVDMTNESSKVLNPIFADSKQRIDSVAHNQNME